MISVMMMVVEWKAGCSQTFCGPMADGGEINDASPGYTTLLILHIPVHVGPSRWSLPILVVCRGVLWNPLGPNLIT
jgi:hypothetical protein